MPATNEELIDALGEIYHAYWVQGRDHPTHRPAAEKAKHTLLLAMSRLADPPVEEISADDQALLDGLLVDGQKLVARVAAADTLKKSPSA